MFFPIVPTENENSTAGRCIQSALTSYVIMYVLDQVVSIKSVVFWACVCQIVQTGKSYDKLHLKWNSA